jgi:hypothetical protein
VGDGDPPPQCCKPLHSNAELVVRQTPASKDRSHCRWKLRNLRSWEPPACKDVSLGAEERPLLEEVTQQSRAVQTVTGNTSLCVIVICKVLAVLR